MIVSELYVSAALKGCARLSMADAARLCKLVQNVRHAVRELFGPEALLHVKVGPLV